jgi:hypothetical protein
MKGTQLRFKSLKENINFMNNVHNIAAGALIKEYATDNNKI